ncbi:MAG: hypothetical protein JWL61_1921 [Gemmatimonadetes bacterium]|jgi:hypothetical protein|nr:hypothetical protein [Gemmatimonadota bacterium]
MTPESFLNAFAQAVVAQSFDRAEKMLAPWVKSALPVGGLKRVVRLARGDNPPAAEFELAELPDNDPASMREGVAEYAEEEGERSLATTDGTGGLYGPPSYPIPDEITDDNFRGCWQIEFQPDEDADVDVDYSYAFYLALVADGKELKIGYLEPVD